MNSLLNVLPPELQSAPALVAGFLTLLGLLLWTAGIKVAKPLAAGLVAGCLATLFALILPTFVDISPTFSAVIGLALGLLLGITAFRLVQGLVLALCLAVLSGGAFYQWQIARHPLAPVKDAAPLNPNSTTGRLVAGLPADVQLLAKTEIARWNAIPLTLRQSMVVIGAGVAILAIFVAWLLPRPTTWVMSAFGGVALLLYGGFTLLNAYQPQVASKVPDDLPVRLLVLAALVAIGLVIQRLYFWPGKRQKQERAKDHPGELAPA